MSLFKRVAISNRALCRDSLPRQILRVGEFIDILILREKDLSESEYETLIRKIQPICQEQEVELVCHTFVTAARNTGCNGIHLTYPDFLKQREQLADFSCIGVSAHSLEEIKRVESMGADYVTISPIFETKCKEGVPGTGTAFLAEVCRQTSLAVYALGGITAQNEMAVKKAGAAGACRMSGYMCL